MEHIDPLFGIAVTAILLAAYAIQCWREKVRLRREERVASMKRHPAGKGL